jgi:homoserine O-acetyltransferase/O-succinyltransferase
MNSKSLTILLVMLLAISSRAADPLKIDQGDYAIPNFRFASCESLPQLRIHYRTVGTPITNDKGVTQNAVLILHGTTGNGGGFFNKDFSDELFQPGQPLDAQKYFLILPDNIGHGKSSKPSDGLRAKFPRYRYADMIAAQHALLVDHLHITHLRLVMGTSMGGMHSWLWAETYPDFLDAAMPLGCLPAPIAGRNRMWRKLILDSIRTDPTWNNGDYTAQPPGLGVASEISALMMNNPRLQYQEAPTLEKADAVAKATHDNAVKSRDANDYLYAWDSSADYNPEPDLEKIQCRLVAVNSADDQVNPPDLGILEKNIARVKNGKAIVIPESPETRGHGTHSIAKLWKSHLSDLLKESAPGAE